MAEHGDVESDLAMEREWLRKGVRGVDGRTAGVRRANSCDNVFMNKTLVRIAYAAQAAQVQVADDPPWIRTITIRPLERCKHIVIASLFQLVGAVMCIGVIVRLPWNGTPGTIDPLHLLLPIGLAFVFWPVIWLAETCGWSDTLVLDRRDNSIALQLKRQFVLRRRGQVLTRNGLSFRPGPIHPSMAAAIQVDTDEHGTFAPNEVPRGVLMITSCDSIALAPNVESEDAAMIVVVLTDLSVPFLSCSP